MKLILASGSPRRRELLGLFGIPFVIRAADIDETMDRVPAFVNAFAPLNEVIVACGAGAIALGFPVVTNEETFRVPKSLIVQKDVSKFNATSLEARNIKIKITFPYSSTLNR